ncbi:MAG: cytochrome B [Halothiobacillus sp. 14-56-357]|uniref:cytochrome b/b6 domain-containing protein n=1 Tax=Halothiobacillus sp. 15-55-196 TaxID=1970382 RepID=UPI000BCD3445|nr:cytochrome b/b6 domain-containing protein [Halothiobacillus sp. 15-55-196]OZB35882.1 MAG: cytochrome B [Halothiobacillus sp. 15-55-196]OZB56694.1 MAG: cytochrome B [Halothiobacillus sp. 14-56-357]OZB79264.1 MAG: cytochrome B [Halothiobacillus sp. 13-55-115]
MSGSLSGISDLEPKSTTKIKSPAIHPVWLRLTHWVNALAVLIMIGSGWRIYNASPLFGFSFPNDITLGGWLGGALDWHFAAMWILVANGLIYLLFNGVSRRFWHKFFPLSPRAVWTDIKAALRGRLSHADARRYNSVQKTAYLFAVLDLVLLVLSGLVLWKSVQFPILAFLLGGYETARYVHFFSMAFLVGFIAIHLLMVLLVPRSLLAMTRGR